MGIEDVIRARARMPSAPEQPPSYESIQPNYGYTASSQELVLVPGQAPQYSAVFHSSQPIILPGQPVSQQQIIYTQPQPILILPGQPMADVQFVNYQPTLGAAPIVIQPGAPELQMRWIAVLAPVPGCPPGLEPLRAVRKLILRQKPELVEHDHICVINRYSIETASGDRVYLATGKPEIARGMMNTDRSYRITVFDSFNRFGSIRTGQACCSTNLTIADGQGQNIITIDGSPCLNRCCFDVDYPLISATDSSTLGLITRKYRDGCRAESCSPREADHEVFEIEFPSDFAVRSKATIIGACIMIDFLDFNTTKPRGAP